MNALLLCAAVLMAVIGVVHSVLGQFLIFRHLRRRSVATDARATPLSRRQVGILWASWHAVSVFGLALAMLLWRVAHDPATTPMHTAMLNATAIASGLAAALVLTGTRGRHPGWIGLLGVTILILLA